MDRGPRSSLPIASNIRSARLSDIPELLRIENRSFPGDRLTRRNFRHLLIKGKARCVVHQAGGIEGYALLLFRADVKLARLYSFAVVPESRKNGVGRALLEVCESDARGRGCTRLRLEVRVDNEAAIRLYRQAGFHDLDTIPDYYQDHAGALRMEKALSPAGVGGEEPVTKRATESSRRKMRPDTSRYGKKRWSAAVIPPRPASEP